MATDLQTLINNVKNWRAEEGHIISPQYHNTLRDAVIELANQIGTGTGPGQIDTSVTYPPVFLPITEGGVKSPEWVLSLGVSSRPPGNSARGWFPVQLPDNATIKSMTVTGQKTATVLSCQVQMMRQTIVSAMIEPIITVDLKNKIGEPFTATANVSGSSQAVIDNFQAVNNDKYQYFVQAKLTLSAGTPDVVIDLYAVQIAFGTSTGGNTGNNIAIL